MRYGFARPDERDYRLSRHPDDWRAPDNSVPTRRERDSGRGAGIDIKPTRRDRH